MKSTSAVAADATPANTAMMGIVHSALRRDLTRCTAALTAATPPARRQRAALAAHLVWMMEFLDGHHHGEDVGLWPMVRALNPSAGELLDQMEHDHAQIAPAIVRLKEATSRYAAEDDAPAREAVVASLSALRGVLDPHLDREEVEMMPVVSRTITNGRWESFNQEQYVKTKSKSELGKEGHWLIDSIDPAGFRIVVGNVPAVPRFVLLHAFAGQYARACAARWGTAVSIKPLQH